MKLWIFDVDGVITDLKTRSVEHQEIIEEIIEFLKEGNIVALASGRAIKWITERVLPELEGSGLQEQLKERIYISAEFGGVTGIYVNGILQKSIDNNLIIPENIKSKAKKIAEKYKDYVFIDPSKETQFSVELIEGKNLKEFEGPHSKLTQDLKDLITKDESGDLLQVNENPIATDLKYKASNKTTAMKKLMKWLGDAEQLESITVFGDSKSDLEMGEEIYKHNKDVTFVYVGEDLEPKNYNFNVILTDRKYDEGTFEYLEAYSSK